MSPSPADVQAAFCEDLVDEWVRGGVTDAVVAPGSRSTPLVIALDRDSRVRVHVVLDERSAGFLAVGLGLASGRPAVVVTTSGTAAVELHPAVVEAAHAGVPLIAATADRPPELHQVGAPQTVTQEGLYGSAVRWACAPGGADLAGAWSWRSVAARSVVEALAGPGPVHLNLAFREPLIGSSSGVDRPAGRPAGAPWHRSAGFALQVVPPLSAARAVVIAGQAAGGPALVEAAERLGWPVLADPRSGCRVPSPAVVASADSLLRNARVAAWQPDAVVHAGGPLASKVVGQWLAALPLDVQQVFVDPLGRWVDPDRLAAQVSRADPVAFLTACTSSGDDAWRRQWEVADRAAGRVFDDLLAPGSALDLSEPAIARAVVGGLPEGSHLVTASSMPVRDVEWSGPTRTGLTVHANRGANGIDGVLSTATGVALASGAPTAALLGDLAFLHDAGALLWLPRRPVALTVVVVDNDGGGIFSFLPQATALPGDVFERYWGTGHGLALGAVARAYGVDAVDVESRTDLDRVLSEAARPGVRVAVVHTDRAANVAAHERLNRAVSAGVDSALDREDFP